MESEQLQNFNERLSQWVSNQGFWFQVRYSLSGSGMKGKAMFHLLRIAFRLLIFVAIIAVGAWIYLMKRTDSERFRNVLKEDLVSGLSATDLEMQGVNRIQGQLEVSRIAAEGGTDTFFTGLEARNIRCTMHLLDGLVGVWDPGIISMARLDLDFRAGADDEKSALKLAEAVFYESSAIKADKFEVSEATVRWGFSERTQGAIESSILKMQRTSTGWRMSFKGGRFRQNWLQGLEIEELVVVCEAGGLVFETAKLKEGSGTVDFSGLRVIGGERPQVKGLVKVRNLNFETILPSALDSFVEGSISGDFQAFGSTNSSEGIGFRGPGRSRRLGCDHAARETSFAQGAVGGRFLAELPAGRLSRRLLPVEDHGWRTGADRRGDQVGGSLLPGGEPEGAAADAGGNPGCGVAGIGGGRFALVRQ